MSNYGSNCYESNAYARTFRCNSEKLGEKTSLLINYDRGVNVVQVTEDQVDQKRKKRCCCNVYVISLFFFLITGASVGSYLIANSDDPPDKRPLYLVQNLGIKNDTWLPFNQTAQSEIIFINTKLPECMQREDCLKLITEMQNFSYNFVIGGDGRVYEVKGWLIQSGYQLPMYHDGLVIGFIGDYTVKVPSVEVLEAGIALIAELIYRKHLMEDYKLFGLKVDHSDGIAMFQEIQKWKQWDSVISMI